MTVVVVVCLCLCVVVVVVVVVVGGCALNAVISVAAALSCVVQAVTESFFELSSVLWTTSIAFTLYMMFFKRKTIKEVEGYFNMYMLFCWGVPLILTIIPGAMDMYGGAGAWCWIKPGHVEWRFLQFYIPLWLAVSFNTYVYVVVIRTTNKGARMARASGSEAAKEMADRMVASVNRLRWYPMILLIVRGDWRAVAARCFYLTSHRRPWRRCGDLLASTACTKASRRRTCFG